MMGALVLKASNSCTQYFTFHYKLFGFDISAVNCLDFVLFLKLERSQPAISACILLLQGECWLSDKCLQREGGEFHPRHRYHRRIEFLHRLRRQEQLAGDLRETGA